MTIKDVLIFGASGFQGVAQFKALQSNGYTPIAASRNPDFLKGTDFAAIEVRKVDYEDVASLRAAMEGIDAIFFQAPAMGEIARLVRQGSNVADAIKDSDVQLTVVNSSMWSPDESCGDPHYDGVRLMEKAFEKRGFPLVILRPTLFMNNLLGDWIKPILVNEGVFRYNHTEHMAPNWLCLEDMAKFMVACLERPDLVGKRLQVGGPERVATAQMNAYLSEAIGRPITHEYITAHQFGEHYWSLHGHESGLPHDIFVDYFAKFHTFNNEAPERPFQCDPAEVKRNFPEVELTDFRTWALAQDWNG